MSMSNLPVTEVPAAAEAVVSFWAEAGPSRWFTKEAAFDDEFRQRFLDHHMAAARRELEHWAETPCGGLALLILLDQFPRNCFRGTGHMFATDSLARHHAHRFIDAGFMMHIDEPLRLFACLPFVHSEALEDQKYGVALYKKYVADGEKWAVVHMEIIERFGRFPHRNPALGRATTPEEQAFLDAGGFAG